MSASHDSQLAGPISAPSHPKLCVFLLVLLAFSLGCSEFVVIGIEPEIAAAFNVSLARAGELVSWFAASYAVMTPVLALSTGRFKRYPLLIVYCIVFVFANLASLIAPTFTSLLVSRLLIGSVAGALLATAVTYIPELVDAKRASMTIAVVYGAFSVAMVLITSIGKIAATYMSWHVVMSAVFVLAVITCACLIAVLPRTGATDEPSTLREQFELLREPRILIGMVIFVFGVGSVYTFYAYITPYLEDILGLSAVSTSTVLLAYGVMCIFSNILSGWGDSRFGLRTLAVTFPIQAVVLLVLWLLGSATIPAIVDIMLIALTMYVLSTPCVSMFLRIARTRHPKALTLASSIEPMSFNIGIAFGTAVGGAVVDGPGMAYAGLVGAVFALIALVLTLLTMRLDAQAKKVDAATAASL